MAAEGLHGVFLSVKMDGLGSCCGPIPRLDLTVTHCRKERRGEEDMRREDVRREGNENRWTEEERKIETLNIVLMVL